MKVDLKILVNDRSSMLASEFKIKYSNEEIILAVGLNQEYYYISSQFDDVLEELKEQYDLNLDEEYVRGVLGRYQTLVQEVFG